MITASKEFKEKLKNGANLVNYADITLSDGTVLNLTYKDFMIGGCAIEDKTTDGKFGVGYVIGKTLNIKIANYDGQFSKYDFYKSIIHIYIALLLDDGTVEKIRKGIYYATVPSTTGDVIEINAVDGMFLLDKDYSTSTTAYPATLQMIISDSCLDCGISIGFRQFDNMDFMVYEKPEKSTYRQVVSWACQIAGYNARIDNDGYMQLIWYNSYLLEKYNYVGGDFKTYTHDTIVDGGDFTDYSKGLIISGGTFTDEMPDHIFRIKSLDVHTDDVQITGVRVLGEDEVVALFGEEGYLIEVKNPFAYGKEQEVANYLGSRMVGMVFRPFTAQVLSNPLYEPFEVVRVSDWKGNVYLSIVNSVSYKIGGYTQISCEAEDPVRNGSVYYSEAAAAVAEARREVDKNLSTYDKAVQNMTQIAGNALGYHTTYETQSDGSTITYLHDKPSLEESKIVYKQTIDGFFISQDGGKSYTAGFDKNGNAVVNILYAIGIVADWIRGGTLTLGGFSDINGSVVILDVNGKEIGRLDKTGITTNSAHITGGTIHIIASSSDENVVSISYGENSSVIRPNYLGVWKISNGISRYSTLVYNGLLAGDSYYTQGFLNVGKAITVSSDFGYCYIGKDMTVQGVINFSRNITSTWSRDINISEGGVIINDVYNGSNKKTSVVAGDIYLTTSSGTTTITGGGITADSGFFSFLAVSGTKSRITKTRNYADRLLYCYETPKPYFGDIGEATLDENGICYVFVDDVFYETINTDCQYQVFLQKYGQGDVWIEERNPNYFVVMGTPNLKFGWELKARQLGFETERLERFVREEPEETIDYEQEAQKYIDNYYKEVLNYEESN